MAASLPAARPGLVAACCPAGAAGTGEAPSAPPGVLAFVRTEAATGLRRLDLLVEGITCGACIPRIERTLGRMEGVASARVNMTTRRLALAWEGGEGRAIDLVAALEGLGFAAAPFDPGRLGSGDAADERALLRAMAIAGFAAGNVMLLSIAIWAGHAEGMGPATRTLLHWFSALVALPAIVLAGRPFFASAAAALRHGRTNMDVPISIGVAATAGMSLFETIRGGEHAYFESAVMLLFFLLIGRYLDRRARGRARSAVERLAGLSASAVTVLGEGGAPRRLPADQVRAGDEILVAAGERIGADATIVEGRTEIDQSLITGESVPVARGPGDAVHAGTINLTGPLRLRVGATGEATLLAEIARLMEAAERQRSRHVALADRLARLYAPVVHLVALATFLGWTLLGGATWQEALLIAVAVLVVTCPCALGLAVPAVQVIAAGRLMRLGILLKSATALERLAAVDTIVFDKTGTLTLGRPEPVALPVPQDEEALDLAASLAAASRHPLARALAAARPGVAPAAGVREVPGSGLALDVPGGEVRLGSRRWCGTKGGEDAGPELWLSRPGAEPLRLAFTDRLRKDAAEVVGRLEAEGYAVEILSGDRAPTVAAAARALGIGSWRADCRPAEKAAALAALAAEGRRVAMVGDGLNDAPALAAAFVSLSPASAADISRTAADAVFQGERLAPVATCLAIARRADRLMRANLVLALAYNAVAVPLAVAGLVTPLLAAASMSLSSLVVVGNALRLAGPRR